MSSSSDDVAARIVSWVDRALGELFYAPPMHGSPETVEFEAILLLSVRRLALDRDPDAVLDAYVAYLRRRFPKRPSPTIFQHLQTDDPACSTLVDVLRGFVEEEKGR